MQALTKQPSSARLCQALADYLNKVDEMDDPGILADAEALLHPLGIPGWPLEVTVQRVSAWGLNTRETASIIDGLRKLGVSL